MCRESGYRSTWNQHGRRMESVYQQEDGGGGGDLEKTGRDMIDSENMRNILLGSQHNGYRNYFNIPGSKPLAPP